MNRFKNGFTIIELGIAIVIIGILIGLSIMNFSNDRSRNIIDNKANAIRNLYIRTNNIAVTSGKDCQFIVDKANNIILSLQNGYVITGDSVYLDPNRFTIIMPDSNLTFTITPSGVVNATDTIRTFILKDIKSNRQKSIFISPLGVMEVK